MRAGRAVERDHVEQAVEAGDPRRRPDHGGVQHRVGAGRPDLGDAGLARGALDQRPREPAARDGGRLPIGAARADGCYGTTIDFVDTPKEAAALAKKQEKLVFVLHVSGHFEDPRFT